MEMSNLSDIQGAQELNKPVPAQPESKFIKYTQVVRYSDHTASQANTN